MVQAPANPADPTHAADVLEGVIRHAVFPHGSPAHPQFLKDAKITVGTEYRLGNEYNAGIPNIPAGETLVITTADPHIATSPKLVSDFILKQLATVPGLASHVSFNSGVEVIKRAKDDNEIRILLQLPPDYSAAQAIADISALNPVHTHGQAANPLAFTSVDSVQLVGASSPEAAKIANEVLAKFSTQQVSTDCLCDTANALTPFAEQLVTSVETAHQAIQAAYKHAAAKEEILTLPSPHVQVQSLTQHLGGPARAA